MGRVNFQGGGGFGQRRAGRHRRRGCSHGRYRLGTGGARSLSLRPLLGRSLAWRRTGCVLGLTVSSRAQAARPPFLQRFAVNLVFFGASPGTGPVRGGDRARKAVPLRGDGVRSDFGFLGKLVVFPDYSFEITRTGSPSLPGWGLNAFCGHTEADSGVGRGAGQRSSGFISTVTSRAVTGCPCLDHPVVVGSGSGALPDAALFLPPLDDGTGFGDPGLKAALGP